MNCGKRTNGPLYSPCTSFPSMNHSCNALPTSSVLNSEQSFEYEPEAPMLSLGERVLWMTNFQDYVGTVRWIGRLPQLCPCWSAGVEFDQLVPNGGNGIFNTRRYFLATPGHVLFLPIVELQKNDEVHAESYACRSNNSVTCGCGHTHSNYHYVNRHRDSTYGRMKHNACPTCSIQDYQMYPRVHEQAPIYGRISSRSALGHEDQSYERYVSYTPAYSNAVQKMSDNKDSNYEDTVQNVVVKADKSLCSPGCSSNYSTYPKTMGKNGSNLSDSYAAPKTCISRRESIFIPSATVKFISGLKEWVSYWVLGTGKKKKRRRFVIKGSKTVTRVIMAKNSNSITGERLSSCNVYSDVRTRIPQEQENVKHESAARAVKSSNINSKKANVCGQKMVRKKKRPAPLPPPEIKNEGKIVSSELISTSVDQNGSLRDITLYQKVINTPSSLSSKRGNTNDKESSSVTKTNVLTKSHKSTKKSLKKRQAPLPPAHNKIGPSQLNKSGSSNVCKALLSDEAATKPQKNTSDTDQKKGSLKINLGTTDTVSDAENNTVMRYSPLSVEISTNCLEKGSGMMKKNSKSGSEDSLNSPCNCISFSSNDSEEDSPGWINNGIVAYQNNYESDDSAVSGGKLPKTGEVCLKISIQKTETNVMTVEELSSPSEAHANDGSSQSSPEISSGEAEDDDYEFESREKIVPAGRQLLPKTVPKISKEVAKLECARRGSVKNLVNAFNMLAQKGGVGEVKSNKVDEQTEKSDFDEMHLVDAVPQSHVGLKSFPTQWQYENNSLELYSYPPNNLLLPIEEEALTEASEHDAHASDVSDSLLVNGEEGTHKNNSLNKEALFGNRFKYSNDGDSHFSKNKACSHCSNHHKNVSHTISNKQLVLSKKGKKRVESSKHDSNGFNTKEKQTIGIINAPKNPIVCASDAALSALLTGKSNAVDLLGENKGAKSKIIQHSDKSKEAILKNRKAIMASLYIEDKSSHRGPMPFLVTPAMSLKKLKKKVEKEYKFPCELQCWVFGETFAIQDDSSLASYGVTETGCPILLYVMSRESKSRSLPSRRVFPSTRQPIYDDVNLTSSESDTDSHDSQKKSTSLKSCNSQRNTLNMLHHLPCKVTSNKPAAKTPHGTSVTGNQKPPRIKHERHKLKSRRKSDYHAAWEKEFVKKKDYHTLMEMENLDLVANAEKFECPVCFLDVEPGNGTVLQECLHTFCNECLASAIQFSDTAVIKCPFRNDDYSCESHLLEREIKSLVSPELFERHLQRSMALAESQALDSFHCKTPDCPGWCLYEDNVNTFFCPVCKHTNCVTCAALHEGRNCRQYQDDVAFRCDSSEEAKRTKEYLDNMLKDGDAMKCPHCQVILMKKWGCDWLKCSMCHTEVCWVTKGPRWGPQGRGDTTGGCKCMVNGVRCHPKCSYCH